MQTPPPLFFPNVAVRSPRWMECTSNWIAESGVLSESQVSVRISNRLGSGGRVALAFSLACSPPILPHFRFGFSIRQLRCSPVTSAAVPCRLALVDYKRKRKLKSERLKVYCTWLQEEQTKMPTMAIAFESFGTFGLP
ncbi:hypothetical protein AOLI_G00005630 [Acnodon oligacanthus]